MNEETTAYELDLENLPPLTEEQRAELKALDEKPENEIDFSDIPPLEDEFWSKAVRSGAYKPVKTSTTVRVDADVLLWLRSKSAGGKGYQTRINAILRAAMLRELGGTGANPAGSRK
jgi:uncharacterized protein (DUF4415 family)